MTTRAECAARDAVDPLSALRQQFQLAPLDARGVVYLDGNSLGALPNATPGRVHEVVAEEWGAGLIASWNDAGWIALAARVAERIAPLIGADAGEVAVGDSTSVNLYKVLSVAAARPRDPSRRHIVSEATDFPTDLYIADSVARACGLELRLVPAGEVTRAVDAHTAVLLLSHVDYRTGRMHEMRAVNRHAHDAGALVVWDLAHSAGAVPVDVRAADADFAVGCGYKYLNGGPGAPAFLWVHSRHLAGMQRAHQRQPLAGWFGHESPFTFASAYRPAEGIAQFQCGTPPVISLAALACGVETVRAADAYGGMAALRARSLALTNLFMDLVGAWCGGRDLELVTPRDPDARGSQVALATPHDGYAIMQALIARGVIGDFRAPDILRFGFAPLYTRFTDAWDAADALRDVLSTGAWREARFAVRRRVT